ncbi:hypothetical protein V5P93_003468 [Actinokineospora auranticolor]|uniref:Secreted protein n=1 Tax=Actinokineospora auranticolor TaxID=155976 RepID=A0A2S6GPM8_9PSEU|nr:hypothetical protein [Actinokineospora auranticolor]PPK67130.1 hypothetical protein CLV40_108127 [Actinokineospora auranticolor]
MGVVVNRLITAGAAAVALTAGSTLASPAAQAATGWNLASGWNATGTQADVVGVWERGTATFVNGNLEVTVTVTDTKTDSHGARGYFRWRYITGGFSAPLSVSSSGKDDTNSRTFSYNRNNVDQWDPFEVKECLTEQGGDYSCGDWDVPAYS